MGHDDRWQPDFGRVEATPPPWAAKRPIRIALLGDFGGGALSGRLDTGDALARRKPLKVEFDTLEDALSRLGLTLTLPIGAEGAAVEVPVTDLESFHPDSLYGNLEVFSALSSLRKRLNTPSTFEKAAAEVQAWGGEALRKASSVSTHGRAQGASLSASARLDDFARLTGRAPSAPAADTSVDSLLRRIVGPFVQPAASPDKAKLLAAVDEALSDAMRAVLHQPDLQNAESLWRGADFLLRRLETSHQLQVHLIDLSAEELAADLSSVDDLAESGLYKLLVDKPSQEDDGGYSYLVGCYHFEATPPQLELLGRAALVAGHAGAPFLTAIDSSAFTNRKEPPHRLVRDAIAALKASPQAAYLGLFGPRFLLRHPYGKKSDPISSFAFEEFSRSVGLRGMLWGHPALLALCVMCVRGGQLTIDDLPFHHYIDDDGDSTALPCTERLINTTGAALLRDFGINGLMAFKGQPLVRLTGVSAINGDGLAAPMSAPRKPMPVSRGAVYSKTPVKVDWAPAQRSAGTVGLSAPVQALAPEPEPAAEAEAPPAQSASVSEAPPEPLPATSAEEGPDAAIEAEDAPVDAAADDTPQPAEPAAAEAPAPALPPDEAAAVDDELAALLASLEPDPAPAADAGAADEPAMDPDLEALLKSLG